MENISPRPPTPGFGRVPRARRVLVLSVLILLVVSIGGGFLFLGQILQRVDATSNPELGTFFDIDDDIDQHDWLVIQRRQLLRTGLHELDQQAELIWDEIDELQTVIDEYQEYYDKLENSERGKPLITDEWTVRYFVDKWGEPLPRDKIVKHCRVQLNCLMFTVERALAEKHPPDKRAAYTLSPETIATVEEIGDEIHFAKLGYAEHRDLLQALSAKAAPVETVTPKTLKEAADVLRNKMTLSHWKHPSVMQQRDADRGKADQTTADDLDPAEDERSADDSSTLRDDMRRSRSGVDEKFADRTLGRDTVRDRNEPPRLSLPR